MKTLTSSAIQAMKQVSEYAAPRVSAPRASRLHERIARLLRAYAQAAQCSAHR